MIGLQHAKLCIGSDIKVGNDNEPIAKQTPLGCVFFGETNLKGKSVTNTPPSVVKMKQTIEHSDTCSGIFVKIITEADVALFRS